MPSTPRDSKFLTEYQKESVSLIHYLFPARIDPITFRLIMKRLERDRPTITMIDTFSFKQVMRSPSSLHVVMVIAMMFMNGMMAYGLALFLPSIVNELGFDTSKTQLLSVGPFATGFVGKFFPSAVYQGLFTAWFCSNFNFCIFVGSLCIKRYYHCHRLHSRCCWFHSFSK